MDGGAWRAAVHGAATSRTRLSDFTFNDHMGLSRWLRGKNPPANAGLIPGQGGSPGEGNGPVFLPGEFHGQRSLVAIVHEVTKSQM